MTVVYIDSVFFLNMVMDYLLVLCTGRLAGIPLRRGRYLLSALLGGLYAAAVFLPSCGWLLAAPVKLAAGALMVLVAFGGEERLLRLMLLFLAVSCGMAGCVLALGLVTGGGVPVVHGVFYTDVDAKVLLISVTAAYGVLAVVFRASAHHGVEGRLRRVRVCLNGRTVDLTALLDTGNGLREGNAPVLVAAQGALNAVLPHGVQKLLTPEALHFPAGLLERICQEAPELRARLLPYHAVGTSSGFLLTIKTDWVEISGERRSGIRAALSPTALGNGYTALWNGEEKGGKSCGETAWNAVAPSAGAVGPFAGSGSTLHWRKRHPAAAADKGAGGGTVILSGAGVGEAGAH